MWTLQRHRGTRRTLAARLRRDRRRWRRSASGAGILACGLASLAILASAESRAAEPDAGLRPCSAGAAAAPASDGAPERLRLAQGGESPFLSFLEGLFGAERPRASRRWRRVPSPAPRRAPRPEAAPPPVEEQPDAPATYRTMCVRLCDGYYWPISFATSEKSFARDAKRCADSCRSSVALYYYPNPGGEVKDMVSLEGRPYTSLGTAFLYRTIYDPHCKCRPHPWEAEAAARHQSYIKANERRTTARGARRRR